MIRKTILLRPMQNGISGYARLQQENGKTLVQFNARGLTGGKVHLYWYLSGQKAREMAAGQVNARGEISLTAEAPQDGFAPGRLQALILLSDEPRPLVIGLCVEMSAGSILDAKNAALALCETLRKKISPAPIPQPAIREEEPETIPREIFLPAINPAPAAKPSAPKRGASVDRLRPLCFPRGFESLRAYFEHEQPVRLFDLPGWRFVQAADGLWVGIEPVDGHVRRVAYACRTPPGPGPYRAKRGIDGTTYQVLWQTL